MNTIQENGSNGQKNRSKMKLKKRNKQKKMMINVKQR